MSKCEHGQKITTFCASQCCVWKQAGGCSSCIKKYHNHMGPTIFVSEEEAQLLIKKFNVDPSTKPKCRSLQQAIFNYFNLIKTQFVSFIDNACMDIINQIGHPYLTQNNLLTTYKRIKKKDYKKIQQKQFRQFFEESQKILEADLIESQKRIYIQKVKKKSQFINSLEKLMKSIEKINTQYQQKYLPAHDGSINLKINQLVKTILKGKTQSSVTGSSISASGTMGSSMTQSSKFQSKTGRPDFRILDKLQRVQSFPIDDSEEFVKNLKTESFKKQQLQSGSPTNKIKYKELQRKIQKQKQAQKERIKQMQKQKQRQKQKQKQQQKQKMKQKQILKLLQQQKKRNRMNSLDRHFVKTNNLQKKRQTIDSNIHPKITPEHDKPDAPQKKKQQQKKTKQKQESSPKRKAFQSKQIQINQKKQKLIDMMKPKQQFSPPRLLRVPDIIPVSNSSVNKQSSQKLSQNGSGSSFQQQQDKLHLFAHTVLPRTQSRQKLFQQSQQVGQKTIIIPVQNNLQGNKLQQSMSPLLKYKYRSKQYQRNSPTKLKDSKQLVNSSPRRRDSIPNNPTTTNTNTGSKDQIMQLTDKQQKSIALLIKSLSVKAQQAIPYLQSSLIYSQDNLSAAQYLSYLYLQLDKSKQCLTICNKTLQKLSHNSMPSSSQLSWHLNINKSAALNKLGRYSQSIVILQQCLKYKQHSKLYKNLGDAYFSIGIFQKSNYYYQKAVALDDGYDQAHYNLAVCLFMQENYHNARFSIIKALGYSPKNQGYLELQKEINLRIKDF